MKKIMKKRVIRNYTSNSAHIRIDDHEKLCRIMQAETNNKINEVKKSISRLEKFVIYGMVMLISGMGTIIYKLLLGG
jgi:hypothetical protein|tara:strand:- start:2020 stop:2250 length:231 start_codon:yes stop_codon:yes gene_type:complete